MLFRSYLLQNQRYSDDHFRLNLGKCPENYFRGRYAGQEVAVTSVAERVEHLYHHAVEMSERKHVDHAVPRLQETEVIETIADIAPDAEERKHHALRHAGGSGRVVDDGEVFRHVMEIINILLCETVWVSLAEEGVYIVSGFRKPLAAGKTT